MKLMAAGSHGVRSIFVPIVFAGLIFTTQSGAQTELFDSTIRQVVNAGRPIESLALSPDGNWGAIGSKSGDVGLIDLNAPSQPRWVSRHKNRVNALAFNRSGSLLAAAGDDSAIDLIGVQSGEMRVLRGHRKKLWALAFSPDGNLLASGGGDKEIVVWDARSGTELYRLSRDTGKATYYLGFNDRGTTLIAVDDLGGISEWDVKSRMRLRQLQDPDQMVYSAVSNFSGSLLALGTESSALSSVRAGFSNSINPSDLRRERRIRFYDEHNMVASKVIDEINGEIDALSISSDSHYLAAARNQVSHGYLSLYDIQRGVEIASYPAKGEMNAVAFSADAHTLASADESGEVRIYEVKGITPGGDSGDIVGLKFKVTSSRPALIPAGVSLSIAVINFDANGVDNSTARTITDLMRTRIAANPAITLVERSKLDHILQEQNLQYSDRVDPNSAVRLGKILGAKKIVIGSIGQLGTSMTIHTEMIDVETSSIDGSAEVVCQQCHGEDLPEAVATLKRYLVNDSR